MGSDGLSESTVPGAPPPLRLRLIRGAARFFLLKSFSILRRIASSRFVWRLRESDRSPKPVPLILEDADAPETPDMFADDLFEYMMAAKGASL